MSPVVRYIEEHRFRSLVLLTALMVVELLLVAFTNFWLSFCFVYILYFALSLYIFVVIKPREWEVGALFVLYALAALLVILLFVVVSWRYAGDMTFGDGNAPDRLEDHLYFAVSMFTSLGFSTFVPMNDAARFFSAGLSLLGSAHSVVFVFIMLGRARWNGSASTDAIVYRESFASRIQKLEERVGDVSHVLSWVVCLLVANLIFLMVLILR